MCNGSTPDSDSVCGGSNPSSPASKKTRCKSIWSFCSSIRRAARSMLLRSDIALWAVQANRISLSLKAKISLCYLAQYHSGEVGISLTNTSNTEKVNGRATRLCGSFCFSLRVCPFLFPLNLQGSCRGSLRTLLQGTGEKHSVPQFHLKRFSAETVHRQWQMVFCALVADNRNGRSWYV